MMTISFVIAGVVIVVAFIKIFKGPSDFISSLGYAYMRSLPNEITEEEKVGRNKMAKFGGIILLLMLLAGVIRTI